MHADECNDVPLPIHNFIEACVTGQVLYFHDVNMAPPKALFQYVPASTLPLATKPKHDIRKFQYLKKDGFPHPPRS
jgi:hypothetical protein